ncbi:metalloregulator ArsR/SmtB family transcription factor [Crocinitomicaceae bacterium]|nr:metalloregulator ArsR/SmtB family transcription factor [Crocinitomicaceae bacterium]
MASIQRIGFSQDQNDLSRIFKALGHPARIAIVEYLLQNEKVICKNMTYEFPISQPAISKHLQILMESGILGYEKIANATYYAVNPMLVNYAKEAITDLSQLAKSNDSDFSRTVFQSSVFPEFFSD